MTEATGKKERDMLLDRLGLRELTLVSFDAGAERAGARARLYECLRGREVTRHGRQGLRTYRYPGILDGEGVRLGQSVFLLPPESAGALIGKLRALRIRHTVRDVYVPG